jgi:hypothetical protein
MARVRNVHERVLRHRAAEAGALLDSLASVDDRLWPSWLRPAQRLDGPLAPGARGGQGPIRYIVDAYVPGSRADGHRSGSSQESSREAADS